jgi:hypothetical protein
VNDSSYERFHRALVLVAFVLLMMPAKTLSDEPGRNRAANRHSYNRALH